MFPISAKGKIRPRCFRRWDNLRSCKGRSCQTLANPTNKREIRSILGLICYYRKYILDNSARASPLTKVTTMKAKIQWSEECDHAFLDLKDYLVKSPILAFPRCSGTFVLDCDSSSYAFGGVLSQLQYGEEKVIAYASRRLNPAQQRYYTTKRELLVVITFMKHFKHYLLGQKFIIRTDHAPLIWLHSFKEPEGLIARWISIIKTSDYEIHYRSGKHHQTRDSFFRKSKRKCNECYSFTLNVALEKVGEKPIIDNRSP